MNYESERYSFTGRYKGFVNRRVEKARRHDARGSAGKLSIRGGHVGPNLGMVEMTIAMHYVFDSPTDKIVFDVSHQCYAHKMLTGRMDAFT